LETFLVWKKAYLVLAQTEDIFIIKAIGADLCVRPPRKSYNRDIQDGQDKRKPVFILDILRVNFTHFIPV
jgi:hypothetical protein